MKYLSNKKGFLGTDNKNNIKEKVVVVPFGLEKTVSYGGGTNRGPKEIIKASYQVELFDEDLNKEPYKNIGIKTLQPFPIKKNIIDALKQIENINKILLDKNKFPLVLGGEHSLTSGAIKPDRPNYSDATLTILSNKNNPIVEVRFRDLYPVSLGALDYDQGATDVEYLRTTAGFSYQLYEIVAL